MSHITKYVRKDENDVEVSLEDDCRDMTKDDLEELGFSSGEGS
jgi:hypothetical protein